MQRRRNSFLGFCKMVKLGKTVGTVRLTVVRIAGNLPGDLNKVENKIRDTQIAGTLLLSR
jgi:hypothetical protein